MRVAWGGQVSPLLSMTLQRGTFHVGTLQRYYKKISDSLEEISNKKGCISLPEGRKFQLFGNLQYPPEGSCSGYLLIPYLAASDACSRRCVNPAAIKNSILSRVVCRNTTPRGTCIFLHVPPILLIKRLRPCREHLLFCQFFSHLVLFLP